ncbi:hypothetical protein [Paenirhodobacter sp.]|uniref:hypothetical protein n=1 Tax=Paenirhodobacter sp. TaxID=1965326 RepID=UPI003B3F8F12
MRPIVLALSLTLAAPAQAALSGFNDSAAQISVIVQSGLVADALYQAPVLGISRGQSWSGGRQDWHLRTERCTATVQVEPRRRSSIGPVSWVLRSVGPCVDSTRPIR